MPLADVAKKFGHCVTFMKKICRSHGITRWPHRKLKCLQKKINQLQVRAESRSESNLAKLQCSLDELRQMQPCIASMPPNCLEDSDYQPASSPEKIESLHELKSALDDDRLDIRSAESPHVRSEPPADSPDCIPRFLRGERDVNMRQDAPGLAALAMVVNDVDEVGGSIEIKSEPGESEAPGDIATMLGAGAQHLRLPEPAAISKKRPRSTLTPAHMHPDLSAMANCMWMSTQCQPSMYPHLLAETYSSKPRFVADEADRMPDAKRTVLPSLLSLPLLEPRVHPHSFLDRGPNNLHPNRVSAIRVPIALSCAN